MYGELIKINVFIHILHGMESDQLPIGLMALLVELCTSIAEVMGSNPVQA